MARAGVSVGAGIRGMAVGDILIMVITDGRGIIMAATGTTITHTIRIPITTAEEATRILPVLEAILLREEIIRQEGRLPGLRPAHREVRPIIPHREALANHVPKPAPQGETTTVTQLQDQARQPALIHQVRVAHAATVQAAEVMAEAAEAEAAEDDNQNTNTYTRQQSWHRYFFEP